MNSHRLAPSHLLVPLAAAFCLVFSLAAPAQTYTPNYIYTIAGGGAVPSAPLSLDLPGPTAAIKDSAGNIYIMDGSRIREVNASTGPLT